jgi:putative nucleotidyltransferase with HDIG domain
MVDHPSETQVIRGQFLDLILLLLKAVDALSNVTDPQASDAIRDIRAVASSLSQLEDGVSGRLHLGKHKLKTLVDVGRVINSSMGLNQVLEEVVDSLISLVHAERGFLVLLEEHGQPRVRIARGIDHVNLEEEAFFISRTIVQRVIASGEPVLTTNAREDPRFGMEASIITFQLRSILCVPMKLKEKIIGVMFVDNRAHTGRFEESDQEMLSAFADQAAMAIYNARLFDELQETNADLESANVELQIAYEATLQGWVRALDLRDKETEGHTQRVTAMAQELARKVGIPEEELVHIKRGALLHDIGKMGIPDGILLKAGALSPAERELMQQHPCLAHEMLSPIDFLKPAIDIPYCHHEKWDGTGYPRNLRGDQIPLAARVFSVVDVWDALTSHRPYRVPLDRTEVRQYIRGQAGSHFDPQIVDVFLEMNQTL